MSSEIRYRDGYAGFFVSEIHLIFVTRARFRFFRLFATRFFTGFLRLLGSFSDLFLVGSQFTGVAFGGAPFDLCFCRGNCGEPIFPALQLFRNAHAIRNIGVNHVPHMLFAPRETQQTPAPKKRTSRKPPELPVLFSF